MIFRRYRARAERRAIRQRLVRLSRETGHEHLVAYHPKTGRQIWMTDGNRHRVALTDDACEEINRGEGWETWHNHPASFATPSLGDIAPLTMPGIRAVGVVDEDGQWSVIKLASKWKGLAQDPELEDTFSDELVTIMDESTAMTNELREMMNKEEHELVSEPRRAGTDLRSRLRSLYAADARAARALGLIKIKTTITGTDRAPEKELTARVREVACLADSPRPVFALSENIPGGLEHDRDRSTPARPETGSTIPRTRELPAREGPRPAPGRSGATDRRGESRAPRDSQGPAGHLAGSRHLMDEQGRSPTPRPGPSTGIESAGSPAISSEALDKTLRREAAPPGGNVFGETTQRSASRVWADRVLAQDRAPGPTRNTDRSVER